MVSRLVLVLALLVCGTRLVAVQVVEADALSQAAERQRATPLTLLALRGQILDRDGHPLAYSRDTKTLSMSPKQLRAEWQRDPTVFQVQDKGGTYEEYTQQMAVYLHRILGDAATESALLDVIRADAGYRVLANDADPSKAALITKRYAFVKADAKQQRVYPDGKLASKILSGLETEWDNQLKGADGKRVVDTASGDDGLELPGTVRDGKEAVPGSGVRSTLNVDVQYQAERLDASGVVVLDARTGEVYAMTGDSTAFEPGALNAVVERAGAVEYGVVDADRYADLLGKFGLGKRTEVGLPGENAGVVPPRNQWSASTLPQLTSGRGMTATLLQLTGMYQAIANDGLLVAPRIVTTENKPDGTVLNVARPEGVRAVSPETARRTRELMNSSVLPGYSVAAQSGECSAGLRCFVGILSADSPRFVVGIATAGDPAALFHTLALYLTQRFSIPMTS